MIGKVLIALGAGVLLGLFVPSEAGAKTIAGWTLAGNESACSLYRSRNGQFVFLVVRSDKTAMLRVHDKEWPRERIHSGQVILDNGSDVLTLPGNFAETSDGWGGFTAETDRPSISVMAATDNLTVSIGHVVLGSVKLDGLSQGASALLECADELPPATSHVATPPVLLSDLTVDWSELHVGTEPKSPLEFRFRLILDERGRPSACQVIQSTGVSEIDEAACALLQRRGRFRPALDTAGQAIASTYQRRIILHP